MLELDEAAAAAALRELAFEDQIGIDRAVDLTAERAHGRTLLEVEVMLRDRLRHEGLDLGERTGAIAQEIVDGLTALGLGPAADGLAGTTTRS